MSMYTEFEKFVRTYAANNTTMEFRTECFGSVEMRFSMFPNSCCSVIVHVRNTNCVHVIDFQVYEAKPGGLLVYSTTLKDCAEDETSLVDYENLTAKEVLQHIIKQEVHCIELDRERRLSDDLQRVRKIR